MTFRATVTIVVLAGVGYAFYSANNDPHGTKLPFGTTDLTSVQEQLAELPADERALVEAYVKRSNGDVLAKQFADPDDPFTARTFGEAIELQRAWEAKARVQEVRMQELHAAREARLKPLRDVVQATVVKAEVLTRNEYQARKDPTFHQRPYTVDKSPAFLTTIRVRNLGPKTIVALQGSLHARDAQAYLPMDLCWIDLNEQRSISRGESIDVLCGHDHRGASQQHRDFASNKPGRFTVVWEPKYVKLADGTELKSER